jgi:hypothetical protein
MRESWSCIPAPFFRGAVLRRHPRTVILSREDGEGSPVTYFEILRFAQDDGGRASRIGKAGRRLPEPKAIVLSTAHRKKVSKSCGSNLECGGHAAALGAPRSSRLALAISGHFLPGRCTYHGKHAPYRTNSYSLCRVATRRRRWCRRGPRQAWRDPAALSRGVGAHLRLPDDLVHLPDVRDPFELRGRFLPSAAVHGAPERL